ncbi:histidine kinase [Actinomadura sp. NEAU-AAG7]|uniref:sensor histidine kinase n=1 Tax=Actinomadura sp. NEAU-AAG7 TaxID=2839640 RepID=UPI002032E83F|nr:histidine kinase [Actinomadura sp. NEAU-AAG7]
MPFALHPPESLRRPFREAGRSTAFVAAGLPPHLVAVALWVWLVGLAVVVPGFAPLPAALLIVSAGVLTAVQRWRYRMLRGPGALQVPQRTGRPALRHPIQWLRSPGAWRQIAYHGLVGPLLAPVEAAVLVLWAAGFAAASIYVWIWALPPEQRLTQVGYTTQAAYITAGGLALMAVMPWLTGRVARLETGVANVLLGQTRAERLQRRVEDLTESRAGVVDAADAERRRIERDLHDGAQQRLVALAVNLGIARATLTGLSAEARRVIDDAHTEAKQAVAELNDLVRGLHPAVLDDRGLDAALSGVAARAPIPVRLSVDLATRPPATAEAVAYFTVSEALTNVVKHARASKAEVTVERRGGTLVVVIADDGVGGAGPSGGTGLAGLAKRAASVDGTFTCHSPLGGPTVITVELPCAP